MIARIESAGWNAVLRAGASTLLACALGLHPALAQQPPAPAQLAAASRPVTRLEPSAWNLPRIFYEPGQRRRLESMERAQGLGISLGLSPKAAAGTRFDGWLEGPSGTHAWVNGTEYQAHDGAGHLRARAGQPGAPAVADESQAEAARFDRGRGELVYGNAQTGQVHLRVGEVEGAHASPDSPNPDAR
jgi:hypothetical protein